MILEQKVITPEIAADMLTRNVGNRALRRSTWQAYAADMKAGKWKQTHEAIAVDSAGNLINGQHRLTAIVNTGISQMFWVATYQGNENALSLPIDYGARRTIGDILGEEKIHVQTAAAIFRFVITRQHGEARPHEIQSMLQVAGKEIRDAAAVSRARERFRGSAMVRAAVVCNLLLHKHDPETYAEVLECFRAWVAGENAMWCSVEAYNKQVPSMDRKFTPNTFCRTLYAFHPKNYSSKVIRIAADQERQMLDELRESLRGIFPNLFSEPKE